MDKQYGNRVANSQRRSSVNIHPDGFKTTLKKIENWKTPGLYGIHGFWFKNSPPYTTNLQLK